MFQRPARAAIAAALLMSATLAGVVGAPAHAEVVDVTGSAFGYTVNVGLFGGPLDRRGFGQAPTAPATASSPSVALPAGGSDVAVTAQDGDGAKAQYGPAVIFGGIWPSNVSSAPSSGPLSASTQGTAAAGSVTSSAHVVLHPTPVTVGCAAGSSPPCTAPGGAGPGPLIANEVHSTCTATETEVTGSATFVGGILETKYDAVSQEPVLSEPIPANPPPNYTRSGTIDHVGDRWTIVLNEQIIGPNSITVNAAHMYLLGDIARGEMIVGSSTCSVNSTASNAAPTAGDDVLVTDEDTPITVSAPGLLVNDPDTDGDTRSATTSQAVFQPGPSPIFSSGNTYLFPSDPAHGTASIGADGALTYTPDPDFSGEDTFTYVVRDPRGASDTGEVTVTVDPVPDDPIAPDDTYRSLEDQALSVPAPGVLGNDTDADGDAVTAGAPTQPAHGTLQLEPDGSFVYTPEKNFLGTDSFSYTATDATGRTDSATVSIVVAMDEAVLLKDVTPGFFGSQASPVVQLGDAVYFLNNDNFGDPTLTGLWRSDGTEAGTVLVKSFSFISTNSLTTMGGELYFQADDVEHGSELWKTNGTEAGTVLVKDIVPGFDGSFPQNFRAVGGTVFFGANDGSNGNELWKTDGTEAGTVLVKDINPGAANAGPSNLTAVGGVLYFSAANGFTTGLNGTELWKSDGTLAGTTMVRDINPGTASSSPIQLTAFGSTLVFRATNGTTTGRNGAELWRSDGTEAGTWLLKDINPGTAGSNPNSLVAFGSVVLFAASDGAALPGSGVELWRTDGTPEGTQLVRDINLGATPSSPFNLRVAGDKVLFSANAGNGGELWRTDGTEPGTMPVADINPGPAGSSPANFTSVGNVVYFTANDGTHGGELWKTDGTGANTVLAKDVIPGEEGSFPSGLVAALDTMFFVAYQPEIGTEPWRLAPPKQAPVAVDDGYSTDEDTALSVPAAGVLANDTDANADPLTVTSAGTPAHGTVSVGADGSFTYTPSPQFSGTDSFTYVVDDGDGFTDGGVVTITVAPVNDSPVAGDDAYSTPLGTPLTVAATGVLGNDQDVEGDGLSVVSAGAAAHGTVTVRANGSFTYAPAAGFAGTDTFTYVVSDGKGGTDTGLVTITVTAADLSVEVVPSPEPVGLNSQLTYTITVRNVGTSTATGAKVTTVLNGTKILSYGAGCGVVKGKTPTVQCDIGTLAPSGSKVLTIVVLTGTKATTVSARSTVTSASPEANLANNTDTEESEVEVD